MRIKIKRRELFVDAIVIGIIAFLVSFLLWQTNRNVRLRKELLQTKDDLRTAEKAGRRIERLERQIQDLETQENLLLKRIPINEKQPLSLIKTLINLGGDTGLKKINLRLTEAQNESPRPGAAPEALKNNSGTEFLSQPQPIYLEMTFQGTFAQLVIFLDKLLSLERLVKCEKLKVERDTRILPYQKISLTLVTYSF